MFWLKWTDEMGYTSSGESGTEISLLKNMGYKLQKKIFQLYPGVYDH